MARKRVVLDEDGAERFDRAMREQAELDLGLPPIDWYEASGIFARHEELRTQMETHKREGKLLKAEFEESSAQVLGLGWRIRKRAEQERREIGTRALANRRIDPDTGEVSD